MKKFRYQAMDSVGCEVVGKVQAETQQEAESAIRRRGLFVTSIRLVEPIEPVKATKPLSSGKRTVIAIATRLLVFLCGFGLALLYRHLTD